MSKSPKAQPISTTRAVPAFGESLVASVPAHTYDFIVTHQRVTVPFANLERYEGGGLTSLLHAACPYDYYSKEIRVKFIAKFA